MVTRPVDRLFVHCGELITLAEGPERGLRRGAELSRVGRIVDGALAVAAGRIVEVGTTAAIRAAYHAPRELDLSGFVVLPGFVDAHTHSIFVPPVAPAAGPEGDPRDRVDRLAAGLRAASTTDLEAALEIQLEQFARCGTTAVEVKCGYGLEPAAEVKSLAALTAVSQRAPLHVQRTFSPAHVLGARQRQDPGSHLRQALAETLPAVRDLCDACDVHVQTGGLGLDHARTFLAAVGDLGLRRHLLADPVPMAAAEVGLEFGVDALHDLAGISVAALEQLAARSIPAVLLPAAALAGARPAPARQLLDAGCAVALASDFNPLAASAPRSMVAVVSLARSLLRMSVAECLHAITINAACALGLDAEIGSLHAGKRADFVALELSSYSQLGAVLDGGPVPLVVIGGEPVALGVSPRQPEL